MVNLKKRNHNRNNTKTKTTRENYKLIKKVVAKNSSHFRTENRFTQSSKNKS